MDRFSILIESNFLIVKKMAIWYSVVLIVWTIAIFFHKQKLWKEDFEKYGEKVFKGMYSNNYKVLSNLNKIITVLLVLFIAAGIIWILRN